MPTLPKTRTLLILVVFGAIFLTGSLGISIPPEETDQTSLLVREGTKLEPTDGFFQSADDRMVFFVQKDKQRFICLENLALQRIGAQSPNVRWRVEGTVTEFHGENYLLIEMAVMTAVK